MFIISTESNWTRNNLWNTYEHRMRSQQTLEYRKGLLFFPLH